MNGWAVFNVKEANNIVCWTCEHFQRYDDSENPILCEGECRLNPPQFMAADVSHRCDPPEQYARESYFAYTPYGNTSWCNRYKRSHEENIPPSPGGYWDCPHQSVTTYVNPYDIRVPPGPFNKKTVEESCWYCTHFQRFHEAETMENWACHGYCHIQPMQAWTREVPTWISPPGCLNNFYNYPWVRFAPRVWCSRWERNPKANELPAPPEQDGVLCGNEPS